eukprot:256106_1
MSVTLPYTIFLDPQELIDNDKLVITNDIRRKFPQISKPLYVLGFIGSSRKGKSSIANGLSLYLSSVTQQNPFRFPAGGNDTPVTQGINAGFVLKNENIRDVNIHNENYVILDCEGMDHRSKTSEALSRLLLTFCSALCVVSSEGTKYLAELQDKIFSGLPPKNESESKEDESNESITFCDTLIYIKNRGDSFLTEEGFAKAFENPELKQLKDQFPHRTLIDMGDESFDVCQGDRKKKAEFKKMSNKEKDALKQPFVENEFAEEFRHGGWTKIAQSIKPARLSDQHLSGQQVLQLMNDSCNEFNEGGYVALSKDT